MDAKETADALAAHMSAQLRVRGEGLADVASRAGRRLPKRFRASVDTIIAAEEMQRHPKLERMVDPRRVRRADRKVRAFLDRQDPRKVRRGEILDVIAKIAFVFVVVVLSIFFFFLWRGDLT